MVPMTNPHKYFDSFHASLKDAQAERNLLPHPDWMEYELLTMLRNVNRVLAHKGQPLATKEEVSRHEQAAAGHIDYTKKFALYCAEMAAGHDPEHY